MDLKKLISNHLEKPRVMQLATSVNNQPWMCNVHFYADENFNFYWISTIARRHSQEIEQNKNVAVAILIHEDTPDEQYVIGISAEGNAELIDEEEAKRIGNNYIEKLDKVPALLDDILAGKNPHQFYRMKPSNIVLFDTKNFPDNPRQEMKL